MTDFKELSEADLDRLTDYAEELLSSINDPKHWNYGNVFHHGNLILGIIAFKQGDNQKAKDYLLLSGQTPGSPQLNTFGPNMCLAKQLLETGEKDSVLGYFDQCAKFWETGKEKLSKWREDVHKGQTPEFGANLVYSSGLKVKYNRFL